MRVSDPPTGPLDDVLGNGPLSRLNVLSLLVQGANALKNGDGERAALLLGAALVAPKHQGLSFAVQGFVVADELREKLFRPDHRPNATRIPVE